MTAEEWLASISTDKVDMLWLRQMMREAMKFAYNDSADIARMCGDESGEHISMMLDAKAKFLDGKL